ncbi:MAG: lipopolysaccharide biosynthesis protein [Verrucomicrobiota bacterium]
MIFKSIGWAALQQWGQQGSQVIVLFVVANIIGPEAIGVLTFANIFMGLAQIFINQGYAESLIQSEKLVEAQINTIFWRMMMISGCVFTVFIVAGSLLAWFQTKDNLGLVLIALAPILFLRPVSQMHSSIAGREMRFKDVARASVLSSFAGDLLAVVLALQGLGLWSLVISQQVKAILLILLLTGINQWSPRFEFNAKSVKHSEQFSRKLFGTNFMAFIGMRADQLIIGTFIGFESLGIYSLVMRLILTLETLMMSALNRVFFSVFSRLQQEKDRILDLYYSGLDILCAATFPALFGLAVVGPTLFTNIMGPQWSDSANIIWPLSIFMALKTAAYLFYPLQLGQGRSDLLFKCATYAALLTIVCSTVAAPFGIVAVAFGVAVRMLIGLAIHVAYANKSMQFQNFRFLRIVSVNLFNSLVITIVGVLVMQQLEANWAVKTILTIATSSMIYLFLTFFRLDTLRAEVSLLNRWRLDPNDQ